jgi:hypothetical protein
MNRHAVVAVLLAVLPGAPAAAPTPADPATVAVAFTQAEVNVLVGDLFTLRSEITDLGPTPTDVLLAHLNVASLTDDVYVDPEDWSASRSHQVEPIAGGATTSVDWQLQAVNVGTFDVYVVLLPDASTTAGTGPLVVSPPVHVTVGARATLNAGGALPVAIAVPLLVFLLALAIRLRTRHLRR